LSPAQIVERLGQKLDVLGPAPRDAPTRHATLRATVEWSCEMLSEEERRAWAECSVFVGGFDADAAEAVLHAGKSALDVVQRLRNKSLLWSRPSLASRRVRFGLYEVAREVAAEALDASGVRAEVEARHTQFFVERGALATDRWERATGGDERAFFADERENLMAAHARALEREPPDMIVYAMLAIQPPLILEGPTQTRLEALDATRTALGEANVQKQPFAGWLLLSRADALERLGRLDEAHADVDEAAVLAATHGDLRLEGRVRWRSGAIHLAAGRLVEAERELDRALSIAHATEDELLAGRTLGSLGALHLLEGDFERAADVLGHARAVHLRLAEHSASPALALVALGELAHIMGRLDEAAMRFEDATRAQRDGGSRAEPWIALGNASLLLETDSAKCLRLVERALRRPSQTGDRGAEVLLHALHALALGELGRKPDTARAAERAEALAEQVGAPRLSVIAGAVAARVCVDEATGAKRADAKLALARERLPAAPSLTGLVRAVERHVAALRGAPARSDDAAGAATSTWERHIRRGLGRSVGSQPALVVAPDGSWFRPPGGAITDLSNRRSLRLIVERLASERGAGARALSVEELFSAGWPTDRARPDAAAQRVYVAVSSLRKLGLESVLQKTDDGYRLDPDVPLVREATPE
jgi:tetratricopeptide (TPR) repeat protein